MQNIAINNTTNDTQSLTKAQRIRSILAASFSSSSAILRAVYITKMATKGNRIFLSLFQYVTLMNELEKAQKGGLKFLESFRI